jgi:hypothetical protein
VKISIFVACVTKVSEREKNKVNPHMIPRRARLVVTKYKMMIAERGIRDAMTVLMVLTIVWIYLLEYWEISAPASLGIGFYKQKRTSPDQTLRLRLGTGPCFVKAYFEIFPEFAVE